MLNILGWILSVFLIISFFHSTIFHLRNYIIWRIGSNQNSHGLNLDKSIYRPFIKRVMFIQLIKLINNNTGSYL